MGWKNSPGGPAKPPSLPAIVAAHEQAWSAIRINVDQLHHKVSLVAVVLAKHRANDPAGDK